MFSKFRDIFKIPELKRKLLFTILLLLAYRIGAHIPIPGVDSIALSEFFKSGAGGGLFGLYDLFVGGAFKKAAIFALGIMPYISASIIIQLLGPVWPYIEKLSKEEEGRKKITQYTRYGTVVLAAMQAIGIAFFLESLNSTGNLVVPNPGMGFRIMTVITLTAGTILTMWLGEQITERGIGNGISLLIFIGIVARYPLEFVQTVRGVRDGTIDLIHSPQSPVGLIFILFLMLLIVVSIVVMTQAQRKIPLQYAKRMIGRRMYSGQSSYIPLRVNIAGVIPIIFADSILMIPSTMASFFHGNDTMQSIAVWFSPGALLYTVLYSIFIIFFTYFYTAIIFNPVDLAENIRKHGGFVPGIRPGKRTAEYIDRILTRITLPGAIFLAIIAVVPYFFIKAGNVPFYFGGTGLLIVVGVALDTLQQIESHLIMRHYEGFIKKGKLKGRMS